MAVSELEAYWLAVTQIEAEQMLLGIQVSSFPDMDKTNRQKVLNSLKSCTKFIEDSARPTMTLEDLARKIVGGV